MEMTKNMQALRKKSIAQLREIAKHYKLNDAHIKASRTLLIQRKMLIELISNVEYVY